LQPETAFIEHFTELVVIVSLYSCGLKISRPLKVKSSGLLLFGSSGS